MRTSFLYACTIAVIINALVQFAYLISVIYFPYFQFENHGPLIIQCTSSFVYVITGILISVYFIKKHFLSPAIFAIILIIANSAISYKLIEYNFTGDFTWIDNWYSLVDGVLCVATLGFGLTFIITSARREIYLFWYGISTILYSLVFAISAFWIVLYNDTIVSTQLLDYFSFATHFFPILIALNLIKDLRLGNQKNSNVLDDINQ